MPVSSTRYAPPTSSRHGFTHYDLDVEPVYVRLKSRPAVVREDAGRWIDPNDHRLGLSTVAARLVTATGGAVR